jgi:hypothetical protein
MEDACMDTTRVNRLTIAAMVMAIGLIPQAVAAQRAEGSFERTLTVSGSPRVDIRAGSGQITVRPGTPGRIEISARIRANDGWGGWFRRGSGPAEERIKRVEANPPVEQSGNIVRIGYFTSEDWHDGVSISYSVAMPPATTLVARTGSGSQEIEGIDGGVEAHSGSGSLTLRDIGGQLRASSGSGSIAADRVAGTFLASAASGSIRARSLGGAISAKTSSGSIDVTQIGSGDVEAESSSGSVRLRGVRGGLRASTSSGSLTIDGEVAGEWRISASSGSVDIGLRPSQGFDLDANSGSGRIEVDFPITVTGIQSKRSVKGAAQGGGPLLRVRTSSGGISIARRT